jgi:hypothetical protein
MRFFSGLRAGYFVVDEFLGGVEVFHEVIVVVEFDYVDVVFCFRGRTRDTRRSV